MPVHCIRSSTIVPDPNAGNLSALASVIAVSVSVIAPLSVLAPVSPVARIDVARTGPVRLMESKYSVKSRSIREKKDA